MQMAGCYSSCLLCACWEHLFCICGSTGVLGYFDGVSSGGWEPIAYNTIYFYWSRHQTIYNNILNGNHNFEARILLREQCCSASTIVLKIIRPLCEYDQRRQISLDLGTGQ